MAIYTKTIPDNMTPILILIPDDYFPKLQAGLHLGGAAHPTLADKKDAVQRAVIEFLRFKCQDADVEEFKRNKNDYSLITGVELTPDETQ